MYTSLLCFMTPSQNGIQHKSPARVRAEGAVCWGEVGAEIATMACSVHGRLEEEAGEGTREDGEVQGQAKAPSLELQITIRL